MNSRIKKFTDLLSSRFSGVIHESDEAERDTESVQKLHEDLASQFPQFQNLLNNRSSLQALRWLKNQTRRI